MVRERSQATIDKILQSRIAILMEIIRTGNEVSSEMAALQIALIGTKEAAEALMSLIRKNEDPDLSETLAQLIVLSPFRDEYRAELELFVPAEMLDEAYGDISEMDPLLYGEPASLWISVAEDLETQFAQEQIQMERAAQGAVLLVD